MKPANPNGFTLIEMLIALAVFAIAALALLRLDGVAVATAGDLAARSGATLVAQNAAALIETDPAPWCRRATRAWSGSICWSPRTAELGTAGGAGRG